MTPTNLKFKLSGFVIIFVNLKFVFVFQVTSEISECSNILHYANSSIVIQFLGSRIYWFEFNYGMKIRIFFVLGKKNSMSILKSNHRKKKKINLNSKILHILINYYYLGMSKMFFNVVIDGRLL